METSFYDSYAQPIAAGSRRNFVIQVDGRSVDVSNLIASPEVMKTKMKTSLYPVLDLRNCQDDDDEEESKPPATSPERYQQLLSGLRDEVSVMTGRRERSSSYVFPPTLPNLVQPGGGAAKLEPPPLRNRAKSEVYPSTRPSLVDAFARDFPGVKMSPEMMEGQGEITQISPRAPRMQIVQAYGHSSVPNFSMEERHYPTSEVVRNASLRNMNAGRPPSSSRDLDGRSPSMRAMMNARPPSGRNLDGRSPSFRAMNGHYFPPKQYEYGTLSPPPARVSPYPSPRRHEVYWDDSLRSPARSEDASMVSARSSTSSPLSKPSPRPYQMYSGTPSPPAIRAARSPPPQGLSFGNGNAQAAAAERGGRPGMNKQMSRSDCLLFSSSRSLFGQDEWETEEPNAFTIEVFPGMDVPLRGSYETRLAIRDGAIAKVDCMDCCAPLSCMNAAEYVICPLCRSVSPIGGFGLPVKEGAFGVALGFTSQTGVVEDDGFFDQQEKAG